MSKVKKTIADFGEKKIKATINDMRMGIKKFAFKVAPIFDASEYIFGWTDMDPSVDKIASFLTELVDSVEGRDKNTDQVVCESGGMGARLEIDGRLRGGHLGEPRRRRGRHPPRPFRAPLPGRGNCSRAPSSQTPAAFPLPRNPCA